MARKTAEELVNEVYTDRKKFEHAIANYFTITNLGQTFGKHCTHWHELCESETEDCLEEEYRDWLKEAKGMIARIIEKKLPWTLASSDAVWGDPTWSRK